MSGSLWTAVEAACAVDGVLGARGGAADDWSIETWSAGGVSIDTRSLKPGEIFVAVKAARDGHDFVPAAFAAGASAALVSRAPEAPDGAPLLLVRDTMGALRDLAIAARERNFGKRIGVTGSAGKTSTKEMLRAMLAACGETHAADRSFNNHLGVPLTLASLPMRAEYSVYEIGMNSPGEIAPLSDLVAPHAAIVTTVGEAHLEFFSSVEGIAEEKASIFRGLKPGGTAVVPLDNTFAPLLTRRAREAGAARIRSFGGGADADYRLVGYAPLPDGGAGIEAEIDGARVSFRLAAAGRHQALNALAALAAVEAVGADRAKALEALGAAGPADGRGRRETLRIGGRTITLVDESYNANPASVRAALAAFADIEPAPGGRRHFVFGDMLELGPEGPALHAGLAGDVENAKIARLHTAGPLAERLRAAAPADIRGAHAETAPELLDDLLTELGDGDVVMAKGSNASNVGLLVAKLREQGQSDDASSRPPSDESRP